MRPVHEWENRSVSCEVDLEPGRYEILPQISATRDKKEPTLDKLVKQFAESNPQKLRQVGMQYDLAHAKGGITDEDSKIEDQRAKERQKALDRKKKGRGDRVRVKVEIDVKDSSGPDVSLEVDGRAATQEGEGEKFEDAAENLNNADLETTKGKTTQGNSELKTNLDLRQKPQSALPTTSEDNNASIKDVGGVIATDADKKGHQIEDENKDKGKKEDGKKEQKEEDEDESTSDESTDSEDDEDDTRWNAVCVICLRVYSQDPGLVISLVKPEDAEEASSLVQGQTPAGATM